jgi:hypothetical protein
MEMPLRAVSLTAGGLKNTTHHQPTKLWKTSLALSI